MKKRFLISLTLLGLLSACLKEETPVEPFDRGSIELISIEMGADYENQVWFNLNDAAVVSSNSRFAWDIAFDTKTGSLHLNNSVVMQAAKSNTETFAEKPTNTLDFSPDQVYEVEDSLAVGQAFLDGEIWVLDLGVDAAGNSRGKAKIQLINFTENTIEFNYGNLADETPKTAMVKLDTNFRKAYFSIKTDEQLSIEPRKTDYDICFTTYTYIFYSPYLPYLVNGVLLNPKLTFAAEADSADFESMNYETATELALSDSADLIGYDWKFYDFNSASYIIDSKRTFIVKDQHGILYKMHFLDFYNDSGKKGYPSFELKKL